MKNTGMRNVLAVMMRDSRGFSMVETLVVTGVILVLTAATGFMAAGLLDRGRTASARSEMAAFSLAIQAYALDCGAIPGTSEGLTALWRRPAGTVPGWNGPYVGREPGNDPWGHAYEYLVPGEGGLPFGIRSLGADGVPGGSGAGLDLESWK